MIKKNKMRGFTLVELLAVIVILAIILVIAVPKVMSVIEDSKKATLEATAKMIAGSAEKVKVQNTVLGKDEEITCDSVAKLNDIDYDTCEVEFVDNTAKVTIKGSGKFAGLYVCNATKTEATAINESCGLRTLTVELDGGTDTVDYNPKYEAGSTVILTEPTKEGYTFNGWTVTGAGASVTGNTLTMGSEATIVTATWEEERIFSTDSWETIVAAVKQAETNGTEYPYEVGNAKTVDMDINGDGTAEEYTIRVANKTKCSEVTVTSKTACGFVLEFADIITDYNMNPAGEYNGTQYDSGTNLGGWPASAIRKYLNDIDTSSEEDGVIYNALPEELRAGIINTYVVSSHGNGDTTGELENDNFGSTDKLYLLSPQEVWGTSFTDQYDSTNGTSRQLDYYAEYEGEGYTGVSTTNYAGAIKYNGSTASQWWLRSAISYYDYIFYSVNSNGYWGNNYAYYSIGVSPTFRLAE